MPATWKPRSSSPTGPQPPAGPDAAPSDPGLVTEPEEVPAESGEAPPEAVRALIARAATSQPGDRSVPHSFAEWRSRLTEAGSEARTPGTLAREALSDEAISGQAAAAVALIREGKLGPWPPSVAKLQRVAERIRESSRGRIIVSKPQRSERVDTVLREAINELLDAASAERTALRFEEMAYVLWKSERTADARACLAAADELRQDRWSESPVVRALFERALAPLLEGLEQEEREREASSLLVKP